MRIWNVFLNLRLAMAEKINEASVPRQTAQSSPELPRQAPTLPAGLWRSILLTQLGECWDDVRNIDSLVWQIPAGIGAILGLILSGLGTKVVSGRPSLLDVAAMFAVVLVSFSLIMAMHKNRMFQVSRNMYMKSIYKQLLATHSAADDTLVPIGLEADDCPMDELPGFVARATHDLTRQLQVNNAQSLVSFAWFGDRMRKMSAYKTMFRVSVIVLTGECFLTIWLLIRFLVLG
jgi:hypothetical protein